MVGKLSISELAFKFVKILLDLETLLIMKVILTLLIIIMKLKMLFYWLFLQTNYT